MKTGSAAKMKLPTPEQLDRALGSWKEMYGDSMAEDFANLVQDSHAGMAIVEHTAERTKSDVYKQTGPTFTLGLCIGYLLAHIMAEEAGEDA